MQIAPARRMPVTGSAMRRSETDQDGPAEDNIHRNSTNAAGTLARRPSYGRVFARISKPNPSVKACIILGDFINRGNEPKSKAPPAIATAPPQ